MAGCSSRWRRRRLLEIFRKMADRALHGEGNQAAQRTKGAVCQHFAQIAEEFEALHPVLVGDDFVDHFDAARGADAAGRAFAAAFDRAEFHGEARLMREIDGVVEDYDSAMPQHALLFRKSLIVERR